jgi:hypothetical protein
MIFWDVMPWSLVESNQRFTVICFLHLQGRIVAYSYSEDGSKTLVRIYQTTRRDTREDHSLNIHRRDNLKRKVYYRVQESATEP